MQSLGIAAQCDRFIGDELAQASSRNNAKGSLTADLRCQNDRSSLDGSWRLPGNERVSSLCLARECELNRNFPGELARGRKEIGGLSMLELQFDLAKRGGA